MYKVNFDYVSLITIVLVSIAFIILLATLTNAANILNPSSINSNGLPVNTTAKLAAANTRNKTGIAAPLSATTTLIADYKMFVSNTSTPARSSGMSTPNGVGFGNAYPAGKYFPITIHGGMSWT